MKASSIEVLRPKPVVGGPKASVSHTGVCSITHFRLTPMRRVATDEYPSFSVFIGQNTLEYPVTNGAYLQFQVWNFEQFSNPWDQQMLLSLRESRRVINPEAKVDRPVFRVASKGGAHADNRTAAKDCLAFGVDELSINVRSSQY